MPEFSISAFQPIAPGVFRAVAEPDGVTLGLIVGSQAALLVDTGSSPAQGASIRAAAESVAGVPITCVVVTHWHWDHLFGLAAFDDVESIGHASIAAHLESAECRQAAQDLGVDIADLRTPSHPIHLAATRDLGGRRVEIVHFGEGHTDGDVVVIVPDADVIFAGDLLESAGPPSFGPDTHLAAWPSAIDGILGLLGPGTVVVPGHGEPFDRILAYTQRAQISALYGQVEHLIKQGIRMDSAYEKGEWPFPEDVVRAALPLAYAELASVRVTIQLTPHRGSQSR